MSNLRERIIQVLLDKKAEEIKDVEICETLQRQGIPCQRDDVRRELNDLHPGVFKFHSIENDATTISLQPKVNNRRSSLE